MCIDKKHGGGHSSPVETQLQDVDAEHGVAAVVQVLVLVVLLHVHLVLLVPALLLLQLVALLKATTYDVDLLYPTRTR